MNTKFWILLLGIAMTMCGITISVGAQEPIIFDLSNVVVGPSRTETGYFHAQGKWSDAGNGAAPDSTEIFLL